MGAETDHRKVIKGNSANFSTVSLAELLERVNAPSRIDYFSFDIEGAEDLVMREFPWEKYTFLSLTVERPKEWLMHMLESHGYMFVKNHGDFGDMMYLHESFPDFENALKRARE